MAKKTKEMWVWVCKECESTDVMQDAWVDINDASVISVFDTFYCNYCEGECSVKKKRVPA